MTFLPMVQRELRVAARRKSTYRLRFWTAILAIGVGAVALLFSLMSRRLGGIGNPLFTTLTGLTFGLCLLAGVFLTADCLSEEKREGTLGLLFLTDLHGYDVVLGKFFAMWLNALYGLLSLLPIIALSLLLGGVTGSEFWRTAAALMNALFVSLAAGICISALARDTQRAMASALGLLLLLVVAFPALQSLVAAAGLPAVLGVPAWFSPMSPFVYASATLYFGHAAQFWASLVCSQALGWGFLLLASQTLPRQWQEGKAIQVAGLGRWLRGRKPDLAKRTKTRQQLLPLNPVLWLISTRPGFGRLAWALVVAWGGVMVLIMALSPREISSMVLNWYGARPFGFIFKVLFAMQVCRFFADARRNGFLEMLLCTPLSNREIIRGQTMALRRTFLWPGLVFIALLFVPVAVRVISGLSSLDFQQLMSGGFGFVYLVITAVRIAADFFALFWFGSWLALTLKKPNLAPALVVLAVLILPSVSCWLDLLADLFFILWGATKLQQDVRWVLARQYQTTPAPPAPGTFSVPPVISQ